MVIERKIYLFILFFVALNCEAKIRFPSILGNHMILQQLSEIKLLGQGEAGNTLFVGTSWNSNKNRIVLSLYRYLYKITSVSDIVQYGLCSFVIVISLYSQGTPKNSERDLASNVCFEAVKLSLLFYRYCWILFIEAKQMNGNKVSHC